MKKINSTFVIMIMLVLFITAIDSISEVEVVEMHKKLRYCSHMKHKCRRTKGPALENIDNCIKNSDAAVECNRLDSLKLLECQYMICWWRS
uniref:Uncharacterized protein n=1 Tax=Strigamia maritima TaxID=126957 RepID=T1JBH9_STRMM